MPDACGSFAEVCTDCLPDMEVLSLYGTPVHLLINWNIQSETQMVAA